MRCLSGLWIGGSEPSRDGHGAVYTYHKNALVGRTGHTY